MGQPRATGGDRAAPQLWGLVLTHLPSPCRWGWGGISALIAPHHRSPRIDFSPPNTGEPLSRRTLTPLNGGAVTCPRGCFTGLLGGGGGGGEGRVLSPARQLARSWQAPRRCHAVPGYPPQPGAPCPSRMRPDKAPRDICLWGVAASRKRTGNSGTRLPHPSGRGGTRESWRRGMGTQRQSGVPPLFLFPPPQTIAAALA